MLIRQKSKQLAGKAAMPDNVISSCQVDKHGTGLFLSLKRVLDILRGRNGLSPVSKSSLFSRELWIDNWFHTGMNKSLVDFVGDTEQRCWAMAIRVLLRLWARDYQRSSPDFRKFESAQAGRSAKGWEIQGMIKS